MSKQNHLEFGFFTKKFLKRTKHNFVCGKHSGIPLCCRFWYSFVWDPLYRNNRKHSFVKRYNRLINGQMIDYDDSSFCPFLDDFKLNIDKRFSHCPCPVCLFNGKTVEVKNCFCRRKKNA